MIDIGGAAQNTKEWFESTVFTQCSSCDGKGFFRPYYLHVNPDGGVRSCLYAIGAGWLGNINQESLHQIESGFSTNSVVTAFSSNEIDQLYHSLLMPLAQDNQLPRHPCAISAILGSLVEQCDRIENREKRKLLTQELRAIHRNIARIYNLQKKIRTD